MESLRQYNELRTKQYDGAFACIFESHFQEGLTKREYFAVIAMQGLLPEAASDIELCVRKSVVMADALIKELNKQ